MSYSMGAYAQVTWTGNADNYWNNANNWSPQQVPAATDDVILTNTGTINITGAAAYCKSITITAVSPVLNIDETLTVTNGISYSCTSGSNLTISGAGAVIVNGSSSISNSGNVATLSVNNTATVTFNGNVSVDTLCHITCSGILNINSPAVTVTGSNTSANAGFIESKGGPFTMAGATFNLGANSYVSNFTGTASATSCTFNLNGINSRLYNNDTFNSTSSMYNLAGDRSEVENSGTYANTSSVYNLTGTYANVFNNDTYTDASCVYTMSGNNAHIDNENIYTANSSTYKLTGAGSYLYNNATFNLGSTSTVSPAGIQSYVYNDFTGVFTLKSDANGSAAILSLYTDSSNPGNNAYYYGTFNVERYVQGESSGRGYRLVSSPVYAATVGSDNVYSLNYVKNSSYITGNAGGGFDQTGNPTLYLYHGESASSNASFTSGNFAGISAINNPTPYQYYVNGNTTPYYLYPGGGFMFFYRGDKNAAAIGSQTVPSYIPTSVTLTATGMLNQGNIAVKEWYNSASTDLKSASNTGYTLVGNPYPCAIDWDTFNGYNGTTGITAANVFLSVYILNTTTKHYDTYQTNANVALRVGTGNASNLIASGQAFFVRTDLSGSGAASLTFTENAKAGSTTQAVSKDLLMGIPLAANKAVPQLLRLKLSIDSINYDDMVIGFMPDASVKYNNQEDSYYFGGMGAPESLASFSADSIPLSINFLPLPKKYPEVIRLKVDANNSGTLVLKRTELDALPKIYELWLMDSYKKDSLDLRNNDTYLLNVDKADANSHGDNRFQVIIRQNKALSVHLLDFSAKKSTNGVPVTWKTENEENYTNFTVERSTNNGVTFDVLGGFASNNQGDYNFLDQNPGTGTNIYRLKLEDLNGAISYSKTVTISYGNSPLIAGNRINIYPNPAVNTITLAINQAKPAANRLSGLQSINAPVLQKVDAASYGIKIISITGNVVKSATSNTVSWQNNVSDLTPGTYLIQVVNNKDNSIVGKSSFVKL